MYNDLSHLNEKELNILIEKYYSKDITVSQILEEYNLSMNSSSLYRYFPPKIVEEKCRHCNSNMIYDRKSKMYGDKYNYTDLYCKYCGHYYDDRYCKCEYCKIEQLEIINYKKNIIKNNYTNIDIDKVCFDDLNFTNKVYLGCIIRALISEDLSYIKDLNSSNIILTPYKNLSSYMYKKLIDARALIVSPSSDIMAFVHDDTFPNTYYIEKVEYLLNIEINDSLEDTIKKIINPSYFNINNINEAYNLWKSIAINECVEYLMYQIKQINFDFNPANKTYTTMDAMLENFSVAQIYNIINRSVSNASKFYLERKVAKQHASNSIIGNCERYANKAIIEKWDLKKYSRIYDLPISQLSEFFFYKVIKIGDLGFNIVPNLEILKNKFEV